jgi:hypothetical protein
MASQKHLTWAILHQLKDQSAMEETEESVRLEHYHKTQRTPLKALLKKNQRRKKLSQLKKRRKNQILSQKKLFLTAMNMVTTSMEKVLKKEDV